MRTIPAFVFFFEFIRSCLKKHKSETKRARMCSEINVVVCNLRKEKNLIFSPIFLQKIKKLARIKSVLHTHT